MKTIICLPDLFIDHFIFISEEPEDCFSKLLAIYTQTGGNYQAGNTQKITIGGNAVNLTKWLNPQFIHRIIICHYPQYARSLLEEYFSPEELCFCKETENPAMTLAFEFNKGNIMVSNAGYLRHFGKLYLTEDIKKVIPTAAVICLTNFMANDNYLELLTELPKFMSTNSPLFLDFADLASRIPEIISLKTAINSINNPTFISLSKNELTTLVKDTIAPVASLTEKALILSKELPKSFLLVHSSQYSACIHENKVLYDEMLTPISPVITTGAGDAWNAAFINSWINNPSFSTAVHNANTFATKYVAGKIVSPKRGQSGVR